MQVADWRRFQTQLDSLVTNVTQVVVASENTTRLALVAMFSEGHLLLEDLPGVGKTLLAKTIAASIGGRFTRVQFTSDLLPSDITGSSIFDLANNRFQFMPGPVFTNILLADELNRAGPRTQSALLEAMGEHQVSADGTVQSLPRPFTVIATQNLAETHGIFPLPNSQLDRFLISMRMGFPSRKQEMLILERSENGLPLVSQVLTPEAVVEMQEAVKRVQVSVPIKEYILNVLEGSRRHSAVALGPSPRGGTFLQRASQTWAAFSGRSFVVPEDIKEVASSVLAHRIVLRAGEQATAEQVVSEVLGSIPVPA